MMLGITLQTWWVQVNDEPGPELILSYLIYGLGGSKSMMFGITLQILVNDEPGPELIFYSKRFQEG